METALDQFTKGSTTIVQSKIQLEPEPPVLIVCPDPPFKTSFFQDHGLCKKEYPGISAYFWAAYKQSDYIFCTTKPVPPPILVWKKILQRHYRKTSLKYELPFIFDISFFPRK